MCDFHESTSADKGLIEHHYYTLRTTKLLGGYTGFTPSIPPSVRLSVRPSRMPCPLSNIYSYGWILFILGPDDHYHERVCGAPWPLTLTYIIKVIRPWLWKSCLLCNVFSSRSIIFLTWDPIWLNSVGNHGGGGGGYPQNAGVLVVLVTTDNSRALANSFIWIYHFHILNPSM